MTAMTSRQPPKPTCDLVWLTGLAREMYDNLRGRKLRLWRHLDRPQCWIDGGGAHSWVADLTPWRGLVLYMRPESAEDWRPWGGRRTDGAELTDASVLGGDRVIVTRLRWRSRVGDEEVTDLVLEFGGRQTNALLVGTDGVVLGVLRPVSRRVNRLRELLPGRTYQPPPSFSRFRLDEPWAWEDRDDVSLGEYLTKRCLATSDLWVAELCARCQIVAEAAVSALTADERLKMETTAKAMLGQPAPYLVLDGAGRPIDHVGFAPTHLSALRVLACQTFAEAARAVWDARAGAAADAMNSGLQQRRYAQERGKLERRRGNLQRDLERALCADELARMADLIMAHVEKIPAGAAQAKVIDWFDPQQREVTLGLDPTRPVAQQAQRLYRRARRLRESIPHIRTRIGETLRALDRLQDREAQETGHSQVRPEPRRGATVPTHTRGKASHDPRDQVRPRRYRTPDGGWLVLVGRNDRENDILSLRVAAPDDIWFHAHGSRGSHVVLRREGRNDSPSRRALAQAAALAAYWSKERGASKVGVSYTLAKHVSKPRGTKPGTVTIRREKLLVVPPALLPFADERVSEEPEGARR